MFDLLEQRLDVWDRHQARRVAEVEPGGDEERQTSIDQSGETTDGGADHEADREGSAEQPEQALAREIRGEEANSKESLDKLWALAGHVARLRSQVARLQEGQKGIWSQRWTWLHEEFVALAGERLQDPSAPPPDPTSAFWVRVAELLYAGSLRASEAVADANRAREAVAQRDDARAAVAGGEGPLGHGGAPAAPGAGPGPGRPGPRAS